MSASVAHRCLAGIVVWVATSALVAPALASASAAYVALGDSYTSAPGVPDTATGSSAECFQSANNYPHLVAQTFGVSLADESCAGAMSADLTTSQFSDVAPQFNALDSETQWVTISVGGDDANLFATAFLGCSEADLLDPANVGAPCEAQYGDTFANEIAADEATIAAAVGQTHAYAPNAKILVVGYPDMLPQSGSCYPQMTLTTEDMAYLNNIEKLLNGSLASAAAMNGVTFVDTYASSIGHDSCQTEADRYIEPMILPQGAFPIHPNAQGELAVAADVDSAAATLGGG
jgi:hypothetical protein